MANFISRSAMKISRKITLKSIPIFLFILVLYISWWGWQEGKNRYVFPLAVSACIVLCVFAVIGWYNEFCKLHSMDSTLAKQATSSHKLYAEIAAGCGLLIFVLTSYLWGIDTDLRNINARSNHLTQAIVLLGGVFSNSGPSCKAKIPENQLNLCEIFNANVVGIRGALYSGGEEKIIRRNIKNINSVLNLYHSNHMEMAAQIKAAQAHLSDVDIFDSSMKEKSMYGQVLALVAVFFAVTRKIAIALFEASRKKESIKIFKPTVSNPETEKFLTSDLRQTLSYRKCKQRRISKKRFPRTSDR